MGIKFNCPNGHKLNVKSFLAGRKGVCPHCGASFRIPSDQQADGDDGDETVTEPEPTPTAAPRPTAEPQPSAQPKVQPAVRPVGSGVRAVSVAPATIPTGAIPTTVHPATASPAVAVPVRAVPQGAIPKGVPHGVVPHAVAVPTGMPPTGMPVKVMPAAAVPAAMAVPVAPGRPLVHPGAIDPIAEAPLAAWYVRPPSGGQFGPARGDVMRKWIGEGRVSSDSLVWREGWQDWRGAGQLFPSLAAASGDSPPSAAPEAPAVSISSRNSARNLPRRRGNGLAIAGVIILVLVCIGLVVALVFVLGGVQ